MEPHREWAAAADLVLEPPSWMTSMDSRESSTKALFSAKWSFLSATDKPSPAPPPKAAQTYAPHGNRDPRPCCCWSWPGVRLRRQPLLFAPRALHPGEVQNERGGPSRCPPVLADLPAGEHAERPRRPLRRTTAIAASRRSHIASPRARRREGSTSAYFIVSSAWFGGRNRVCSWEPSTCRRVSAAVCSAEEPGSPSGLSGPLPVDEVTEPGGAPVLFPAPVSAPRRPAAGGDRAAGTAPAPARRDEEICALQPPTSAMPLETLQPTRACIQSRKEWDSVPTTPWGSRWGRFGHGARRRRLENAGGGHGRALSAEPCLKGSPQAPSRPAAAALFDSPAPAGKAALQSADSWVSSPGSSTSQPRPGG